MSYVLGYLHPLWKDWFSKQKGNGCAALGIQLKTFGQLLSRFFKWTRNRGLPQFTPLSRAFFQSKGFWTQKNIPKYPKAYLYLVWEVNFGGYFEHFGFYLTYITLLLLFQSKLISTWKDKNNAFLVAIITFLPDVI